MHSIRKKTINSLILHKPMLYGASNSSITTGSTYNLVSMLRSISLYRALKNPFLVNFPYSDFRGLLICSRGHVPGPKTVKNPSFAISGRLTDF